MTLTEERYSDGTVIENAFSNETTRIILPDGSLLEPGRVHYVTENDSINLQLVGEQ